MADEKKIFDYDAFTKTKAYQILQQKLQDKFPVSLKECVEMTEKFVNDEITQEEYGEFGDRINVRVYIPITQKMQTIMRFLMENEVNTGVVSPEIIMTELYKNMFFEVLLGQYAQIDISPKEYQTYENYDLLYPIFYPFITAYCKEDYNLYFDMLRDCMSLYGVTNISEGLNNVNVDELRKATQANRDMIKSLKENKDVISNLRDVLFATDGTTKKVVEEVKRVAVEKSNEKIKGVIEMNSQNNENEENMKKDKGEEN